MLSHTLLNSNYNFTGKRGKQVMGYNVMGLFDGMCCGRMAMEDLGLPIGNYLLALTILVRLISLLLRLLQSCSLVIYI